MTKDEAIDYLLTHYFTSQEMDIARKKGDPEAYLKGLMDTRRSVRHEGVPRWGTYGGRVHVRLPDAPAKAPADIVLTADELVRAVLGKSGVQLDMF
ncbi:MAG: hypothetical protein M1546_00400 [Chloroflexi bacterium]|nr:hypothetical protein [Chloroflexota bacterium]